MPVPRTLTLSDQQRYELIRTRDTHPKAYVRERAAALLKIADGTSPLAVAKRGLLRRRDPGTVYDWLNRFEKDGPKGLLITPGRGRKPAFSP
jgi:transposase